MTSHVLQTDTDMPPLVAMSGYLDKGNTPWAAKVDTSHKSGRSVE